PPLVAVAQTSGTFIPTGNMTVDGPILTLLRNGKVLITGGRAGSASAELYNPSTGTFTATGSMLTAGGGVPTLLNDGRVLIVGADNELYDPSTGTFTATGEMVATCKGHYTQTFLVGDGTWMAGGRSGNDRAALASAELYDPSTGTFTATGSMLKAGSGPATLLYDGRVLIVGADNELYDPATGTFTVTGAFAGTYAAPSVGTILLGDGT